MATVIIKLSEPDVDLTGATLSTPAFYQTYTLDGVKLTPTGEKAPYNTAFSSNVRILPQDIGGVWSVTLSNGDRYMADMTSSMLSAGVAITVIFERTTP